jgi:hypothetical protein
MADLIHNIAKGRGVELARRSNAGADASGALRISVWNSTDTDDAIRDADTVAAIEALAATIERTPVSTPPWGARKIVQDAGITLTLDDSANEYRVDIADQTWTAVPAANNSTDLGSSYDTSGTDADSVLLPMSWHDFVVTTDGSDVTAVVAATGLFAGT